MQVRVEDRRGKQLTTITLGKEATTDDLKTAFAKECKETHHTRESEADV